MAPPPPSASYLWKLEDSETDIESDTEPRDLWNPTPPDLFRHHVITDDVPKSNNARKDDPVRPIDTERRNVSDVPPATLISDTSNEEEEEDDIMGDDEAEEKVQAPSHHRKRKKHKKKKKKKSPAIRRHVSFHTVTLFEFQRCLGMSVVPTHGGWPLGMEYHHGDMDPVVLSLDAYETEKYQRLLQRQKQLLDKSSSGELMAYLLETRQWDYKPGKDKNPLFGILHETDRMHLLLRASDLPAPENEPGGRGVKTRSRSGSVGGGEQFNHIYTATLVHQIRNELEQIRISRTGATGCTCRKLNVTAAGKKSHRRGMKLQKVKDELRKRQRLPVDHDSWSREDLEQALQSAVDAEPCCLYADSCFCARNEIPCQADTCSCWHASHQAGGKAPKAPTQEDIQTRCGNVVGMYVVDIDAIDAFRTNYLHRLLTCPFIDAS